MLCFEETVRWTTDWYKVYYTYGVDAAFKLASEQLEKYMSRFGVGKLVS